MKTTRTASRLTLIEALNPKPPENYVSVSSTRNNCRISVVTQGRLEGLASVRKSREYPGYERRLAIAAYTFARNFARRFLRKKRRRLSYVLFVRGSKKKAVLGLLDGGMRFSWATQSRLPSFNGCLSSKPRRTGRRKKKRPDRVPFPHEPKKKLRGRIVHVLVILLPLLNSILCGLFGRYLGSSGCVRASFISLFLTALVSWITFCKVAFWGEAIHSPLFPWVHSGCLGADWCLFVDALSASMLIVVTTVSFLVHVYSSEYLGSDPHMGRFFSYISLFTFFMVSLVTADGFLQLFFGWEGVGLCSYLLISFWYTRVKAGKAAIKAVLVNRVADVFIVLGLGLLFFYCGTLSMGGAFSVAPWVSSQYGLDALCLLLFLGAMGKSAQLGLHTWLPDAMEGPTPVSALIHAATMVTAGVFLVVRCSSLFEYSSFSLGVVAVVGALTAFVAATIALLQHDIKKVIAYSTCSQLGYMFFSCGLSNYGAGLFHLFNHAFFKALLFLSAGSLIHGWGDEQDMRRLGGSARIMPATYACVLLGSLSLGGFPFLSGFYSKDFILETAAGAYTVTGTFAYTLGSVTALLTSFYSFRLIFLAFIRPPSAPRTVAAGSHEPGPAMLFPMGVLAVGSIFSGYLFKDMFIGMGSSFTSSFAYVSPERCYDLGAEFAPFLYKFAPAVLSLSGVLLALLVYSFAASEVSRVVLSFRWIRTLLWDKWHFDKAYNRMFVSPALALGYSVFFKSLDKGFIEQVGPTGIGRLTFRISKVTKGLQSGYIHSYLTLMVAGIVLLLIV